MPPLEAPVTGTAALRRSPAESIVPLVDGRIAVDLPCTTCKYNLRSLWPDAKCPECGTKVALSVDAAYPRDLLCTADPKWVATVASGMHWVIVSAVMGIPLGCLGWPIILDAGRVNYMELLLLIPCLVSTLGHWKLTTRDPDSSKQLVYDLTLGDSIRSLKAVELICQLGYFIFQGFNPAMALLLFHFIAGISSYVLMAIFVRALASRIPSPSLANQITWVLRGYALVLLGIPAAMMLAVTVFSPMQMFLGRLLSLAFIAGYVFLSLWMLVILARFHQALRRAASDARQFSLSLNPVAAA